MIVAFSIPFKVTFSTEVGAMTLIERYWVFNRHGATDFSCHPRGQGY